jgi:predicted nucleotidyltransferase
MRRVWSGGLPRVYPDCDTPRDEPGSSTAMLPVLAVRHDEIADLCPRFRVSRLEAFGSAARATDFDPERSDIDILVVYDPTKHTPGLDEFFGLQEALAAIFARKVDLITAGSVENPYIRAGIERDKQVLYAA